MRPATRYCASVSAPASRSACAARTAAIETTPSYACGNGSTPSARRRASLSRRAARTCGSASASGASDAVGSSGPAIAAGRLLQPDVDLRDLELALLATRQQHRDDLIALGADQRLADGR